MVLKYSYSLVLMVALLAVVACKGDEKQVPPQEQTLSEAVNKLRSGNYRGYMEMVADANELDSTQLAWRRLAVQQHTDRLTREHGALSRISVYETDSLSDSVCTLYYYQHFASGDSLECSQTLVKRNGSWKLKI